MFWALQVEGIRGKEEKRKGGKRYEERRKVEHNRKSKEGGE